MSIKRLFTDSLNDYYKNPIMALPFLLVFLLTLAVTISGESFFVWILVFLIGAALDCGSFGMAKSLVTKGSVNINDFTKTISLFYPRYLVTLVVVAAISFVGFLPMMVTSASANIAQVLSTSFVLTFLLGIVYVLSVSFFLTFYRQAMIVENLGIKDCLTASFVTVKKNYSKTFSILLVLIVLYTTSFVLVSFVLPQSVGEFTFSTVISFIVNMISPLSVIVTTRFYIETTKSQ